MNKYLFVLLLLVGCKGYAEPVDTVPIVQSINSLEDLVGSQIQLPDDFRFEPIVLWDYLKAKWETTDWCREENPTWRDFLEMYGNRPEPLPQNGSRLTVERLRDFLIEHYCKEVRFWFPGAAGTMDHIEGRLNLRINETGTITSFNWG